MAEEGLGPARIPIEPDLDPLDKGLDDAKKKMEGGLAGIAQKLSGSLGKIARTAIIGGVGALAAGVAGIGAASMASWKQFDDATDGMISKTGASGAALQQMQADATALFKDLPVEIGAASDVVSTLTQRLGMAGQSAQDVGQRLLMMGTADAGKSAELYTRVMGDWSVKSEEAAATLDRLFKSSQLTGIGVDELMGKVVQFGSPLRLMGFSLDESAAMFGKWEKEGVNAELVMGSLRIAAAKFADANEKASRTQIGGVKNMEEASKALADLKEKLAIATQRQSEFTDKTKKSARMTMEATIRDYTSEITALEAAMAKGEFRTVEVEGAQKSLADSLRESIGAIQSEESATNALAMGIDVFGARAGPDMVAAIREGRFAIDDLVKAMGEGENAILETAFATMDFPEKFKIMRNRVETALKPLGDTMANALGGLLDKAGPLVDGLLATLVPKLQSIGTIAGPAIGDALSLVSGEMSFDDYLLNLEGSLSALSADVLGIDPQIVTDVFDGIHQAADAVGQTIEGLKTKWDDLQPTIDRVAGFIQDNATPILAGLGAIVATVVIPSFIAWAVAAGSAAVATIAAALPVIAVVAAIGAGVALLVAAWQNDWGGIATTLTTLWEGTIQPALETLKTWLEINIPVAIQTLTSFWSDTLLPAIQAVWTFIQTSLVPMFEALGELLSVTLSLAVTALAGLWQNVLLPAVTAVSDWFTNNVIPALESAWSWISEKLSPALETVTGWFDKAKGGLEGLGGVITKVTGWFQTLADKVANFKLPDVLTPGSPTPMEEGLRGIADAVVVLTTYWMDMASGMSAGQAATIKNIGSAFKDMGKGVKELAGSIKELTQAQASGGSSLEGFDINPWLEQLDRITSVAMAKIQQIIERIGYNKIHKLKLTAGRLREIVQAVVIDFSAMKETKLPDLDTWFGQLWDVFDRAATLVNRVRDRVGNNDLIKKMAEAAQSIAGVFTIIAVKLDVEAPGLWFLEKLDVFLQALEAAGDVLIPRLRALREKWGGTIIDEAADVSSRLGGVFDVLSVSKTFQDLTTEDKLDEDAIKVPLADALDKLLADLSLAADKIIPELLTIKDKWGLVLETVQQVGNLLRDVFGGVAEAYQSAVDFSTGDTLDLNALSSKLSSLGAATAIVMGAMTAPIYTAAPGLAGVNGGAAASPTAITVNIYGADGGLRASYTEETNDAHQVDIQLSEALGAA